jgi:hypothetical protein
MTTLLLDRAIAKEADTDFRITVLVSLVGLAVTLALALSGVDLSFAG